MQNSNDITAEKISQVRLIARRSTTGAEIVAIEIKLKIGGNGGSLRRSSSFALVALKRSQFPRIYTHYIK